MPLDEAKFSGHMSEFVAQLVATDEFECVKRRQVNVLKENEFPLLAVWSDRSGDSGNAASDGQIAEESTYWVLVAIRLGQDQEQDIELGKYIKLVKDTAETFVSTGGARFTAGDWEGDNNANEGDGAMVWAAIPVSLQFDRDPGEY